MSFPEYLKDRISEDYKNLIIQKLEEIKGQTEDLRSSFAPAVFQSNQSLKDIVQREVARLLEVLDNEFAATQAKFDDHLTAALEEYQASWYHSDISAFQQQLEMLISDIISNIPVPPKKENADLHSLAELGKKLDAGNTQSEILNIVLQHISGWADRAVLFIVKGDQATGWAAFGLGDDWDANRVRAIRVNLGKDHVLRDVVSGGQAAYGPADKYADNAELFSILGTKSPLSALACPVMVRGKIAGVLYADLQEDLNDQPDVANLLSLAARMAGNAIDLLQVKTKTAPAATAASPAPAAARPGVPTMVTVPSPAPPPPPPPAAPEPPPPAAPAKVEEEEPGTIMMTAVSPPEEEQSTSMMQPVPQEEPTATTTMMPPVKPAEVEPQDQKLHDDAKRFARLLVSEIKLYNEAQVSAGRENKDIYDRLKEDIERSRRMYMERVPQHIHTTTNYFFEELVRTLANGDPSLLGM